MVSFVVLVFCERVVTATQKQLHNPLLLAALDLAMLVPPQLEERISWRVFELSNLGN